MFVKIPLLPGLYSLIRLGNNLEKDSPQKVANNVIFVKEIPETLKDLTFSLSYMSLHPVDEVQIKISRSLGQHQQPIVFYSVPSKM